MTMDISSLFRTKNTPTVQETDVVATNQSADAKRPAETYV